MRIYCYQGPEGNVGDDLNAWMWPRLLGPELFDDDGRDLFIGIGSVLDGRHADARRRLVFGAGARSAQTAPDIRAPGWEVLFVRGPHTAAAVGLGRDGWISDPAILAPRADAAFRPRERSGMPGLGARIGFIPYYRTSRTFAAAMAYAAHFQFIPPTLHPEAFLTELLACDAVIAEAMHGAILADAFRVPWAVCRLSSPGYEKETHRFKWADWLDSLDLAPVFAEPGYSARSVGRSWRNDAIVLAKARLAARRLRRHVGAHGWTLSDADLLADRQARMLALTPRLRATLRERAPA